MALSHSTAQANGTLSGSPAVGGTTYNSGLINIYTGSAPANANAAVTGTLLAAVTMNSTAFAAPSGGVLTAGAMSSVTIAATGTAGYGRMVTSADTGALVTTTQARVQFAVGTSGSDMNFNTLSLVSGGSFTITSLTYTHPA